MHQPLSLTHFTLIIPLHSNANHHLSPLPTTLALHLNTPHLNPPKHTPKDTALLRINSRLARPKASSQKWMGEGVRPTLPLHHVTSIIWVLVQGPGLYGPPTRL